MLAPPFGSSMLAGASGVLAGRFRLWYDPGACLNRSERRAASFGRLRGCPLIPSEAAESKRDVFDIYTIIFLALAVFIFLRLRSVLGQRTGRECPPYDHYAAREAARPSTNDNVVTLPQRPADVAAKPAEEAAPPAERWKGIAEKDSPAAAGLDALVAQDPAFDPKHFLTGARAAYEMIVTAYAQGDRRSLKNLLAKEVYDG